MPSIDEWIREIKAEDGASGIGMFLCHQGVVRGTSRDGTPVSGMLLEADEQKLAAALAAARSLPGIRAVRAWVNQGSLAVGDDIMQVLVAGDVRENVFAALQRLVTTIKTEVVAEMEVR